MNNYLLKPVMVALFCLLIFSMFSSCKKENVPGPPGNGAILYHMPEESARHEGTWLQWPHDRTYGPEHVDGLEPAWIEMTRALQSGEKVHIVAYDATERSRIETALNTAGVTLTNVDFYVYPNDDVWIRDNGPIYAFDTNGSLAILDWGFNGWGNDAPYSMCDQIPEKISTTTGISRVDLNAIVLEGGAIEHDGQGTMMATRSAVTHKSRNPDLTETELESWFRAYLGITNFIWLDGEHGFDITDMHIDGLMKFLDDQTIITMDQAALLESGLSEQDIQVLLNAQNASGSAYRYVYLPLTQNNVVTPAGKDLGYKGSYVNFYIGNQVALVPTYNDPNDASALAIIQEQYPGRTVVGIDCRYLYSLGGMVHCVTQQQPAAE